MFKENRPGSKSKSKSKERTEKRKNGEPSKIHSSSKETKEKDVRRDITKKTKVRSERGEHKEFNQSLKKPEKREKRTAVEPEVTSYSIDKSRRPTSFNKIWKSTSKNASNQFSNKPNDTITDRNSSKNIETTTEKLRRRNSRYSSNDHGENEIQKESSRNSNSDIGDYSIDKIRRTSLATKSLGSTCQNLITQSVSLLEQFPSPKRAKDSSELATRYSYKDDFEDYTDDFEEETEEEDGSSEAEDKTEKINKLEYSSRLGGAISNTLMGAEARNSDVDSPLLRRIMIRQQPASHVQNSAIWHSHYSSTGQRQIDFANASTTNWEKMSVAEKRHQMLKNLIGMEVVHCDLLDHHPVREYDFYVQMFGNTEHTQVQTQTGDDDLDRYIQTEDSDQETVWTQIPYSDSQGWGTVSISDNSDHYQQLNVKDPELEFYKAGYFQTDKFRKFISTAGQVFIEMLRSPCLPLQLSLQQQSSLKLSTGYCKFSLGDFVKSARVTSILHRLDRLFVAYYIEETANEEIASKSIIIEFDVCAPDTPLRIMLCDNEVRCLCTSPNGTSALFAGLNDGSCVAFDLTEPSSAFSRSLRWFLDGQIYPLWAAAYDTSFKVVVNKPVENQYAVISVNEVPIVADSLETYQLVSINEVGAVIVWRVIRDELPHTATGLDFGLRPGAHLQMTQTSMFRLDSVNFRSNSSQKTIVNCLLEMPTNQSQFIAGTSNGTIASFVRSKAVKSVGPRMYRIHAGKLVGYSSGCLFLYEINKAHPVLQLEPPEQIRQPPLKVFASSSTAAVFYTIYKDGFLLLWNLAGSKKPEFVNDMNLKGNLEVTAAQLWANTTASNSSSTELLAIGFSNGEMQLHALRRPSSGTDTSLSEAIEMLNVL